MCVPSSSSFMVVTIFTPLRCCYGGCRIADEYVSSPPLSSTNYYYLCLRGVDCVLMRPCMGRTRSSSSWAESVAVGSSAAWTRCQIYLMAGRGHAEPRQTYESATTADCGTGFSNVQSIHDRFSHWRNIEGHQDSDDMGVQAGTVWRCSTVHQLPTWRLWTLPPSGGVSSEVLYYVLVYATPNHINW